MKSVRVALKQNPYTIFIGSSILTDIGKHLSGLALGDTAVIVTDPLIQRLHGDVLTRGLKRAGFNVKIFTVPAGEKSKSIQTASDLMKRAADYDVFKKIFIAAFGGGVIGDLAGFAASVYKRGVPYVQIPTTLLAQIDSAIGGKAAVDLPVGKNLVGTFYQPKLVFSDVSLLSTLPKRQIRNGLAEAVKYGVICDRKLFNYIAKNYARLLAGDSSALSSLVYRCSLIKARVVEQDEKETKGIRTILNFGHTIGHAIETAGGYHLYHHGEAIALGMRAAAEISYQLGMLKKQDGESLNKLLTNIGLPEYIEKLNLSKILSVMKHDKKFLAGRNRFVLAQRIGKVKVIEGVPLDVIKSSLQLFHCF